MTDSPSQWQILSTSEKFAIPRGVLGAIVGASAGMFVVSALWNSGGMYAPAIIGLLTGVGCALLSKVKSWPLCAVCVVVGFCATVYWQYNNLQVQDQQGLVHFFQNIGTRRILFLVLSTAAAGWAGFGREYTKNL